MNPPVVDCELMRGSLAAGDAPLDLVIEVPHGATTTADFDTYAQLLTSPLPTKLVDFFLVNTDQGAPELAFATARALVAAEPTRLVAVVRSRIPRTFIDCNRRIDAERSTPGLTPGIMPWVSTADDHHLLRQAYGRYQTTVQDTLRKLAPHGGVLLLHTYAPRSVGVDVDANIVANLHAAYQPEAVSSWPLRPELDVIGREPDGTDRSPPELVAALRDALPDRVIGDSETYPLTSSTTAHDHVIAHLGRALCVEVRRDLLVDHYAPFAELPISPARVAPIAAALATTMRRVWS